MDVLTEIARFAHSGPATPYYLRRLVSDLQSRIPIADHFKDHKMVTHVQAQLGLLEDNYQND